MDLKEFAKKSLIKEVREDLHKYFDFNTYQTDVDADYFSFEGLNSRDTEFELDLDNFVVLQAEWRDADLDDNLDFELKDVKIFLTEYDEDGKVIDTQEYKLDRLAA